MKIPNIRSDKPIPHMLITSTPIFDIQYGIFNKLKYT